MGLYYFGGDYNPEQWPEATRAEDLELMQEAGVNLVTVGVFSWSWLQPAPDEYSFDWLDRTLDDLHSAGIGVALATPTASPPPWFTLAHPEAMPQNREGVRLTHGSRDTYCVNAPAYRAASRDIAHRLATRYASHPAVRLWHVHNEYGTWCYCDHCAVAFRQWLSSRYRTLEALNEAWTTAFWGQRYGCWEHVLPPRATQYLANPAQQVDYRRFLSDSMLTAYREQREMIREAGSTAPVTTNFVLGAWVPIDHDRWAREVDIVAIDHYPSSVDSAVTQSAFAADAARGWARGRPWLLVEHPPRDSELMARIALGHIARGSQGALYFQWRAARGGAEQWHPALVPHEGADSSAFREAVALGARLRELPTSDELPQAEVALWYDEQCLWALHATHHLPVAVDYAAEVQRCHTALETLGYAVDVVPPAASLAGYRLVIVPAAYLLGDAAIAALQSYADGGGTILIGQWSGVVDENLRVRNPRPFACVELTDEVLAHACSELNPVHAGLPPGVQAIRSRGALWLFNHTGEACLVGTTILEAGAVGTLVGEGRAHQGAAIDNDRLPGHP